MIDCFLRGKRARLLVVKYMTGVIDLLVACLVSI